MKRWKGIFLAFLLILTQIPTAQAVETMILTVLHNYAYLIG